MTTDAEIRAWARSEGIDVPARGKVPDTLRDRYDDEHATPDKAALSGVDDPGERLADVFELSPTPPGGASAVPGPTDPDTGEVRPTPPPSKFSLRRRAKDRSTRPKHRRVSIESLAAGAWAVLGQGAQAAGLVPTGRVLTLQAPVAGMILEDTLRGTVIDRLVQPLARTGESAKELGALIGPPVIVSVLTARPEMAPALLPILKGMLREWAMIAGPKMRKKEQRERKAMEQMGVSDSELDGVIDGWIASIFAEPTPGPAPADVGEEAGPRAA